LAKKHPKNSEPPHQTKWFGLERSGWADICLGLKKKGGGRTTDRFAIFH